MKILYLTPGCFDKGGISRYNRYQIDAFSEIIGSENVRTISLLGPDSESFEGDFSVYYNGTNLSTWNKLKFTFVAIWSAIIWRPDVIACAHVNFSGLGYILKKMSFSKLILNVYGLEVWSGLSKDASLGLDRADYIISDCHFTANYLKTVSKHTDKNITVIWDCVDLDKFKPQPEKWKSVQHKYNLPERNEYFIILTLGRIAFEAAHKGYDRLIEVFKIVTKTHSKIKLVFAGKGNMVDHLKNKIKQFGLENSIVFTGMIHDDDMAALYSYAHLFSLVSDRDEGRGEGIPLTPLEAMACGTPIIVGNHDGSQEAIIPDYNNGFVIDPMDLKTHSAKIALLVGDTSLLDIMSKNAQEVALTYFSYEGFVVKHKNFLKEKFSYIGV